MLGRHDEREDSGDTAEGIENQRDPPRRQTAIEKPVMDMTAVRPKNRLSR
jgi:hypothetical protein